MGFQVSPSHLFFIPGPQIGFHRRLGRRPFLNQDGKSFPPSAAPTRLPFLIITTREVEFKDFLLGLNFGTLPAKVEERGGFLRDVWDRQDLGSQVVFATPKVRPCSSPLFMVSYGALPR